MRILERTINKHPVLIILVLLAITAAMIPGLFKIDMEVSVENFIPETDIERKRYDEFIETFGRDTFLLVLIPVDSAFSNETLSLVKSLSSALDETEEVSRVYSIADAIRVDGTRFPPVEYLAEALPLNDEKRKLLRETVLSQPIYLRKVVAPDGETVIITIYLDREIESKASTRIAAVEKVREIVAEELGERHYELTGVPVLKTEISRAVQRDVTLLAPTVAIVSMLFLWLAFRRLWAMMVSAAVMAVTLIWTLSTFGHLGFTLSMATSLLPSLVMAICLAQIIFIISQYQRSHGEPQNRITATVRRAAPPCFLAALTTSAGFSSLTAAAVVPVRQFGVMAAVGIAYAFVASILLVPALMRLRPGGIPPRSEERTPRWVGFLTRLTCHRGWIAVVTLIVISVSVFGILQVFVETSPYDFFNPDTALNRARSYIKRELGSASTVDVMIRRKDGELIDGTAMMEMADFRKALIEEPLFLDTAGLLEIGRLVGGGEKTFVSLIGDRPVKFILESITRLSEDNKLFVKYLSSDGRTVRMTLVLREHSAENIMEALDSLEPIAREAAPNLDIKPTGQTVLFTKMVDDLFLGQILSVALILTFVTIIFIITYRSLTIGLISLVPNVLPIILTLGVMGLVGIPLNILTIMVSSIAIGIAVDDTIHFMHHLRRRLLDGSDYDEAIDDSLRAKGRPILFTSLLLTSAFLTLLVSDFLPTIYLGALTALTMLAAVIGDLVLLPALLRFFRPRFRGKAVVSDKGVPSSD